MDELVQTRCLFSDTQTVVHTQTHTLTFLARLIIGVYFIRPFLLHFVAAVFFFIPRHLRDRKLTADVKEK